MTTHVAIILIDDQIACVVDKTQKPEDLDLLKRYLIGFIAQGKKVQVVEREIRPVNYLKVLLVNI